MALLQRVHQDHLLRQSLVNSCLLYHLKSNHYILPSFLSVAGTPTGVTVSRTALTSARISWTAPSLEPAGYEVFHQEESGNRITVSRGNTSSTELILTGLRLGETYSIFVVAFGAEGAPVLPSAHSNTAIITFCELIFIFCGYQKS